MEFKELIKHIDLDTHVILNEMCGDDVIKLFHGVVIDIPWVYLNLKLDTDKNGEAIGVCIIEDTPYITIYLREDR